MDPAASHVRGLPVLYRLLGCCGYVLPEGSDAIFVSSVVPPAAADLSPACRRRRMEVSRLETGSYGCAIPDGVRFRGGGGTSPEAAPSGGRRSLPP